jgi:hypothetical protein
MIGGVDWDLTLEQRQTLASSNSSEFRIVLTDIGIKK